MGIFRKKMGKPVSEETRIKRAALRLRRIFRLYGNPDGEIDELITGLLNAESLLEVRRIYGIIASQRHTRFKRELKNAAIEAFGKCGSVEEARRVFDEIEGPRIESYRAIFEAYVNNGHLEQAKRIFFALPQANSSWWIMMMAAYARYGKVAEAAEVYQWMPFRKAMGWTLLLIAYARNGLVDEASKMLESVPSTEFIAVNAVLAAHARAGNVTASKELFDSMPVRTSWSWNSLAQAFAQAGDLAACVKTGNLMPERTSATWVAMIRAYGEHGMVVEARKTFDNIPRLTVDSCNTLIVAYARNGYLGKAEEVYNAMVIRSSTSWASIIHACTMNSFPERAIDLFYSGNLLGQQPDKIVLLGVLYAHFRLQSLDEACGVVRDMVEDYGVQPCVEHYCSIVTFLLNQRRLEDAEDLSLAMPFETPAWCWKLVLETSKLRRDCDRALRAAQEMAKVDPSDSTPFGVVAGLYLSEGRLQEAVDLMLAKGLTVDTKNEVL